MVRSSARFRTLLCAIAALAFMQPAGAQTGREPIVQGVFAVAVVTVYPGDTITKDMVDEREFGQLRPVRGGYVASARALVGKIARRTLLPGQAIPANAVENAKLVRKGMPAQLVFEEGGLTIIAVVTPLQDGELGELIKVRNLDSGLIVHGTVQQDGSLRTGEPVR
ncbi:flagella basal body P-ring formation protein FlgA [Pseudochelatococcus lubricantis]|uniref:Flagella basal body P-ring formation protein FlgA n=1 Tax=Pseudochelatococcus lubricantis TaxID=1538102 RepID=A0ABX0UXH5_9HYPH|nr:flagellar basal body P-ring formation chaperone FlgA [Pseudochelatococcus lubricantis]NIJ57103.1 flagella basal body P-ring formation protein FlgA [Pseudochelatococcus lubricantis]